MNSSTATICRQAADLLEEVGWCRGWTSPSGAICGAHAIFRVLELPYVTIPEQAPAVFSEFVEYLISNTTSKSQRREYRKARNECGAVIVFVRWNDVKVRTQGEVVRELRNFADELDQVEHVGDDMDRKLAEIVSSSLARATA